MKKKRIHKVRGQKDSWQLAVGKKRRKRKDESRRRVDGQRVEDKGARKKLT
ncbi:MAG: hypothetical protein GTO45_16585 [Candidatus Aminicenantes bacterium]|nr:hypothetical protein [Candidatus Aminicenantes bacterium]NIM80358.1 hypothetical protein [Candidatus Aminicenantes bacterium]NIN19745.1 hypothetical protein [Candidatus Aminicenantes bacterium]NIN43627.1 hypothetical protein [Candidatus Aminicenantes bacterium]NIN86372.1 hypothetical protein [Candidatus Aminicenantes bacterium]